MGQVVYSPNYKAFVTVMSDADKQALPVQSEEYADLMGTAALCLLLLSVKQSTEPKLNRQTNTNTVTVSVCLPFLTVTVLVFVCLFSFSSVDCLCRTGFTSAITVNINFRKT